MVGGTWNSQNKVRPGVYIRFRSADMSGITVGERGTVAICEPMSWGPVAAVTSIAAGQDVRPVCGYDITNSKALFLREIFKGTNRTASPKTVLLYRPPATGSAAATAKIGSLTVTAAYPGIRGNDISVSVSNNADSENGFVVTTIVDGEVVDSQSVVGITDLVANAWVIFSGTGNLEASTGVPLTGGADGTVQATAYTSFLESIEAYKFDVLIYDGSDATVQSAMSSFIKRLSDENGQYAQLVTAGMSKPDSRYVINVVSGVTLSDRTQLTPQQTCWWVGGASAAARYNESLTYAVYPDAIAVSPVFSNNQVISELNNGSFVLFAEDGIVRVEQDINSLVTYTTDIGRAFSKNRVMRLCNTIANDIYKEFAANYLGVVNNNDIGRTRFKSAIVGYLIEMEGNQGIQDFSADDVEVLAGSDIDSILVNIAIHAVDSVEKVYMTIEVS